MKKGTLFILILLGLFVYGFKLSEHPTKTIANEVTKERLLAQVTILKAYIVNHPSYNPEMAYFIDMKVMSGKNRFFIYDLKKDEIIDKGLVAHGSGSETGNGVDLKFSNTPNSYCTALGKYAIGEKYSGVFGTAYRLKGLDKTNNNALARSIVLHHYNDVPYSEQNHPIVNSLGCPMVNKTYFERIEKQIDNSKKRILLTIYY
jgi:hypothetical protein